MKVILALAAALPISTAYAALEGELWEVSTQMNIPGMVTAHHDFNVLPDGSIATMLWNTSGTDAHNSVVERAPDGRMTTVVADLASVRRLRPLAQRSRLRRLPLAAAEGAADRARGAVGR